VPVQDEFRTPDRPVNLRWAMVARTTVTIDGAARATLSSAGRTLRFGAREPASANLNIYPTNPPPAAIDARNEGLVFLFALRGRQVGERLGAQVEGEEVADRAFRAVDRISVDGGPVPGAVGGVEIEATPTAELSEAIIGEQLSDAGAALLAEHQAAGTFEGRENRGDRGTLRKQGTTRCRKPRPLGWS